MTRSEAAALLPEWSRVEQRPLLAASLEELRALNAAARADRLRLEAIASPVSGTDSTENFCTRMAAEELSRNKLCKDGAGFFVCSKAENPRNTLCISRFDNAATGEKDKPECTRYFEAVPEGTKCLENGIGGRVAHHTESAALLRVGLYLVPEEFDAPALEGVRVKTLPALAPELRRLERLTVRGCFVRGALSGVHGKALGRFFRSCYQSAKLMSAALPCGMPYLCAEGALDALSRSAEAHPEALEEALTAARIVAAQNETAFYAKLWIT